MILCVSIVWMISSIFCCSGFMSSLVCSLSLGPSSRRSSHKSSRKILDDCRTCGSRRRRSRVSASPVLGRSRWYVQDLLENNNHVDETHGCSFLGELERAIESTPTLRQP